MNDVRYSIGDKFTTIEHEGIKVGEEAKLFGKVVVRHEDGTTELKTMVLTSVIIDNNDFRDIVNHAFRALN